MFCGFCGHALKGTEKFCPGCGGTVKQVAPTWQDNQQSFVDETNLGNVNQPDMLDLQDTFDQGGFDQGFGMDDFEQNPYGQNNFGQDAYSQSDFGQDTYTSQNTYQGHRVDDRPTGKADNSTWKDYFTADNIERFAPAAALFPLAMFLVTGVLGSILGFVLGGIPVLGVVITVLFVLLKIVFCLGAIAATGALIYLILNYKNPSNVWAWVAPVATICASIACIGLAFSCAPVAWIFGIISVLCGFEMLARITIADGAMDTPINPGHAFSTYKRYYDDYKEKHPTTKQLEKAGYIDPERSSFDGTGLELFGLTILASIVCTITCGIAAPWMICKIYKWKVDHTVINGRRLTFSGNGGSLLGHWILWEILTVITCGLYSFFLYVALRKWELERTFIAGEPVMPGAKSSYFDGNSFEYMGYGILGGILATITCGLGTPWVVCMIQKWDTKHQVVNNNRLAFSGSGLGFLGEFIIIAILTAITCGLYTPWGVVRMNKYIVRNTDFVA